MPYYCLKYSATMLNFNDLQLIISKYGKILKILLQYSGRIQPTETKDHVVDFIARINKETKPVISMCEPATS